MRRLHLLPVGLAALLLVLPGCDLRQRMFDQPKYEAHEGTDFFEDGLTSRPAVEGTVARGELRFDTHYWEGKVDGELATTLPSRVALTADLMHRGRERFDIFCSPCHDRTGQGNGMVVQRGLKQPPSFHEARLREASIGYLFDVQTNGFGAMFSYASRVPVADRWAIAAYIRALQLSQQVEYDKLPSEDQSQLPGGELP
jgi:mono/diheme cytochrome c family protein